MDKDAVRYSYEYIIIMKNEEIIFDKNQLKEDLLKNLIYDKLEQSNSYLNAEINLDSIDFVDCSTKINYL